MLLIGELSSDVPFLVSLIIILSIHLTKNRLSRNRPLIDGEKIVFNY